MAQIDSDKFVQALSPLLHRDPAFDPLELRGAMMNHDERGQRGIVMCYGETEGAAAIESAYRQLKEHVTPKDSAEQIARAFQIFAATFPEGDHNLTYPHFLLHGIARPTVQEVVAKIVDNARIIHESSEARHELIEACGQLRPALGGEYRLQLDRGATDDFHGLSLELNLNGPSFARYTAKTGFLLDKTNRTTIFINVQGRSVVHRTSDPQVRAKDKRDGREFFRLASRLGTDPRSFVLSEALVMLKDAGYAYAKAIKPEHHVMFIGAHAGFSARYEQVLIDAGFTEDREVYRALP